MQRFLIPGMLAIVTFALLGGRSLAAPRNEVNDSIPSKAEWATLYDALRIENWESAYRLSADFLRRYPADSAALRARLTYMYLCASTGQVIDNTLSYGEFEKRMKGMVGEKVTLPMHGVGGSGPNIFLPGDAANQIQATVSNRAKTSIFFFEHVTLRDSIDIVAHDGEKAFVRGRLVRVEINPSRSVLWVARLYIDDATIRFERQ